jgi:hypothetical protein
MSRFRDCDIRLHLENNYVENDVFRAYSRRIPMFNSHGFMQRPGHFIARENFEAFMSATGRVSAIRESFIYGVQLALVSGAFHRVSSLSFSNFEPALVLLGQTLRNNCQSLLVLNLDNVFLSSSTQRMLPFVLQEANALEILRITYANLGGKWIHVALKELGRNARLREVDFSGNEISVTESVLIARELWGIPSLEKIFFDFTGLCVESMLYFVHIIPHLQM